MKKIKHSLVLLFTYIYLISFSSGSAQELTPEQIYEKANDCVVVILSYDFNGKQIKQGSGVVISEKGWVVTNYHVFAECEKMEVKHGDKIIKYTDIIGVDVEKDILILKIEENTFPSIPVGNIERLKVGQRVYAIGSPLGLENSMSEGIISGLRNVIERNKNYIQITASISPGSSGGAVVNNLGEIIGISTSTLKGGQNLNFAIPISDILEVTLGSYSDRKSIDANNYYFKGYNATQSGNYKNAIDNYTKCLELFPSDADSYGARGLAYFYLKNYTQAISDYNKAIEINRTYADVYFCRGVAYHFLENYTKAILDYDMAIEINSNYTEAYYNLGRIYTYLKNDDKAIPNYDKAIELDPNKSEAYLYRGSTYAQLNNYSKAISDYTRLIEINPDNGEAYYLRGYVYSVTGNKIKACEDMRKSFSLGYKEAKIILDQNCK